MKIDCLILAGGIAGEHKWRGTGIKYKSLLVINNDTLINHIITAVKDSNIIDRIVLVAPIKILKTVSDEVIQVIEGEDIFENLLLGVNHIESEGFIVMAADMPFLDKNHLINFMESIHKKSDIAYPLVSKGNVLKKIKIRKYNYYKLYEGEYIGSNYGYIKKDVVLSSPNKIRSILLDRRSQSKLTLLVNKILFLKYIIGHILPLIRPKIKDVEKFVKKLTNANFQFVELYDAFAIFDIDFYDEYRYAMMLDTIHATDKNNDSKFNKKNKNILVLIADRNANHNELNKTIKSISQNCPKNLSLQYKHIKYSDCSNISLSQILFEENNKQDSTVFDYISLIEAGFEICPLWYESFIDTISVKAKLAIGPALCQNGYFGKFLDMISYMENPLFKTTPFYPYYMNIWFENNEQILLFLQQNPQLKLFNHIQLLKEAKDNGILVNTAKGAVSKKTTPPNFFETIRLSRKRGMIIGYRRRLIDVLRPSSIIWRFRTFKPNATIIQNIVFIVCDILSLVGLRKKDQYKW